MYWQDILRWIGFPACDTTRNVAFGGNIAATNHRQSMPKQVTDSFGKLSNIIKQKNSFFMISRLRAQAEKVIKPKQIANHETQIQFKLV